MEYISYILRIFVLFVIAFVVLGMSYYFLGYGRYVAFLPYDAFLIQFRQAIQIGVPSSLLFSIWIFIRRDKE